MYSSSESTGGGSSFPRSSDQCHAMKTFDSNVNGTAMTSGKVIPDVHSSTDLSQFVTVPVQNTQDNVEAPSAKQGTDYRAQAPTYFPTKQDYRNTYAKNSASSQKEVKKNLKRSLKSTNSEKNKYKGKSGSTKYVQQSLLQTLYPTGIIDQVKATVADLQIDANMSEVTNLLENLGLLSYSIPKCNSRTEVAVQLALAFKTMYRSSVIEAMLEYAPTVEYIKNLFGYNIFSPQAGDGEDQDWLASLPALKENWNTIKCAPIFEKISNLISIAASIGLCSVTNLSWNVEGVEIFRLGSLKKHSNAIDFFGALLDTIITFIEGGYECFRQGSLAPMLFSTDAGAEFDELYFTCVELHQHAMIFNLAANPVHYKGELQVITDLEYTSMLNDAVEMAESAYKSAKGTWQASVLEKRLITMRKQRADYSARRIDGTLRYAPYTVYIWGASGVGKSTISQLVMSDCLSVSGANPDPRHTAIIKESDKYDSTLKSDTQGIYLDDMGNTKMEYLDKSPCERMIDINNNMVTYANKADLVEKGKIEIRPHVFVITSNAPLADHARRCSIEPFSIVRRADVHVSVKVKPAYALPDGRLNSKKANADFPDDSFETDVWDLQVYLPNGCYSQLMLGSVEGKSDGTTMDIHSLLAYLTKDCVSHFANQRALVKKSTELVPSRKYCKTCKRPERRCICFHYPQADFPPDDASLETIATDPKEVESEPKPFVSRTPRDENDASSEVSINWSLYDQHNDIHVVDENEYTKFTQDESFDFVKQAGFTETFESMKAQFERMPRVTSAISVCIPLFVVQSRIIQRLYLLCHARDFLKLEGRARLQMIILWVLINSMVVLMSEYSVLAFSLSTLFCFSIYFAILAKWKSDMCYRMCNNRELTSDLFASLRRSKAVQFFSVCAMAKIIHKIVASLRVIHDCQATLAPQSVADIRRRDEEVNPWCTPVVGELHVSHLNDTMTLSQVMAKVSKNLFHATLVENNFQQSCDILALGGDMYLLPMHIFENRKDLKVLVTRNDPSTLGGTFRAFIGVNEVVPIPGKDLCVVPIPSGGVRADITHLFPDSVTVSGNARLLYRHNDGILKNDPIRANYIRNSESGGAGYHYLAPYNTFAGMCGAVIIGAFAKFPICGIHLRGVTGTPSGKALTVTRSEIKDAIAKSHAHVGGFPVHTAGTFPVERYDKQVVVSRDIHPNSPLNYLPEGSNVEYLGRNNDRASHTKSEVVTTPISKIVEEVTGVPRQHGPPKFDSRRMWQASLAHSANASPGVEPSLLEKAVIDYTGHILEVFKSKKFCEMTRSELVPLGEMETLCGRDGARFIDAMKKNTSKGFPLSGPKSDMITLLNPDDYPEFSCPAECDKLIMDEFYKMEDLLAKGERCYAIYKACVKDESTKIGKDKVRVFQAADWAFQLLVRKYYLPIARLLSLFPLVTECAVGVNAQGPEWDQLARHMKKFGADRIFAGDYSKYDLRMPAQLILAAFKCFINIAEECGNYTARDITIMKGIATEVSYSCVSYNGDVIIHSGSNPSGQNMTVYVNCVVNSLLMRCAYYHLYPRELGNPEPFRHNCAVMTYGDDVKGSVRTGCDWFNHISYSDFLKARDMVFTMPDKESEPTPYMNDLEADFLKRHNRFDSETNLIHGVLDETSIFKSLHTVLRSKAVSMEDQSAQNIDGALREWWQYGKQRYEMRRDQMREVATRAGISHLCNELEVTYEQRMEDFKEKYDIESSVPGSH
ncbi:hypothetical protein 1 [Beihai picorna-like virus 1]|uniref:hypothetical protein 1 n=1 Tax=Beihai picorna-like virus 1 TaxID=1922527 RepID=UPI00090966C3|nr:hypothetical protein 1 [Beihai picorna-like virus 1]APG76728.1 hypothetical protein 1 [Beihai picorna-like virus 1]APG76799.1 hypothetical protein 1 [Beihai picorna-like virus 1]APG76835.1 hypothetical protein 1 [Beihai picorna-like virus 1]APG76892.1 hypothetical protein 1 [Beihai picorna-like virus 1]APG78022.1 hypothetical protein 1 [Beihai picorna-like virus 1]